MEEKKKLETFKRFKKVLRGERERTQIQQWRIKTEIRDEGNIKILYLYTTVLYFLSFWTWIK